MKTMDELWLSALNLLEKKGNFENSRNGGTMELMGFSGLLHDVKQNWLWNSARNASPVYAAGELLWYLSGSDNGEHIKHYAPSYEAFLMPDGKAWGAYGRRMFDPVNQIEGIIRLLHRDPDSRQAVVAMWDRVGDLSAAVTNSSPDIPCTLTMQFLLRDGLLNLIVNMRSNDVWLGMPYDIFCFTEIQKLVAAELDVYTGWYQHNVGSLHLYDKHREKALLAVTEVVDSQVPRAQQQIGIDGARTAVTCEGLLRLEGGPRFVREEEYIHCGAGMAEQLALCNAHAGGEVPEWLDGRLKSWLTQKGYK
jgi:thymidylate synthase